MKIYFHFVAKTRRARFARNRKYDQHVARFTLARPSMYVRTSVCLYVYVYAQNRLLAKGGKRRSIKLHLSSRRSFDIRRGASGLARIMVEETIDREFSRGLSRVLARSRARARARVMTAKLPRITLHHPIVVAASRSSGTSGILLRREAARPPPCRS